MTDQDVQEVLNWKRHQERDQEWKPILQLTRATDQTIATGTDGAAVSWSTAVKQVNLTWVIGTPTLATIVVAGWYEILASASFAANDTGFRRLKILRNSDLIGSTYTPAIATANQSTMFSASAYAYFAIGDTVSLTAIQNSGGNLALSAADYHSPYLTIRFDRT